MNEEKYKRWLTDVYSKNRPKGFNAPNHYAAGIRNINNRLGLTGDGLFAETMSLDKLENILDNASLTKTNRTHLRSFIKFKKYEIENQRNNKQS